MTSVFAALLGGIAGVALLDEFGHTFLIGGLFGYLIAQLIKLRGDVRALTRVATPATAVMPAPPVPAPAPIDEGPFEATSIASRSAEPTPAQPTDADGGGFTTRQTDDDLFLRMTARLKTFLTGGNTLVRVGVVLLFFGVAFLLKYAAEHARLPIEFRLLGTSLGALVLLGIGWRLRHKRAAYGLALEGGAIGILYLTIFASLRLYQVLPATLAFALLVAIVICATLLAVLQDSLALAALSVAGGFLAPVLASTGSGDHVALFAYYALLSAGILAIAWFKSWRLLNLVGFGFTFVIGALWGYRYYQPAFFASTEPFLVLFFLFYVAISVLHGLRQPPRLKGYVDGTLVFGVPIVGFALQAGLVHGDEFGLAWSALVLALFYISLAWLLWRRAPATLRTLTEAFLALGVVFLTLAIPLAVDGRWTTAAWALEGAGILWVGVRQHRLLPRVLGTLLQVGAGLMFLTALHRTGTPFLNAGYLGTVMVALSGLFSAFTLHQYRVHAQTWERPLGLALFVWGTLWWTIGGLDEIARLHRPETLAIGIVFLTMSASVLEIIGTRRAWPPARYAAFALLPALIVAAAAFALHAHPFAHGGVVAWPLALAAHYWTLRRQERTLAVWCAARHAVALWLLVFLAAWELSWAIKKTVIGGVDWAFCAWGLVPAVIVVLLRERAWWPLRDNARAYMGWGAGMLAALTAVWLVAASVGRAGDPAPLPYVPLLNPVDLVSAIGLLAGLAWMRRVRTYALIAPVTPLYAGFGALAFLWLNAVLFRTLHHLAGVPYTLPAMLDSMLVQSALSLFWTVLALALMMVATRVRQRMLWIVGAALLAGVVLKLFLIDLASSGTIARIISFLGVGVLMLVMGYVSPVPPRGELTEVRQ